MKIKKRDLAFFFLGIVTFFLIESIYNWDGTKKAFRDGFNDTINSSVEAESKNK